MKASEFLKLFPEVKTGQSTGGGCTAWEVELPHGAYVLITDGVDACEPTLKQPRAMFGVDFDCAGRDEPRMMTWAEAAKWLRGVIDASRVIAMAAQQPHVRQSARDAGRLSKAEQFFFDNAGASWKPPETQTQGKIRGARALAAAETAARDGGYAFEWRPDPHIDSREFSDSRPYWRLWECLMRDAAGHGVVGSLSGIDFGRDGEPWGDNYRRVVEAELALEYLPK